MCWSAAGAGWSILVSYTRGCIVTLFWGFYA
nr:MAG TPA: hypothetical protein [Caudoviricetes sp.]